MIALTNRSFFMFNDAAETDSKQTKSIQSIENIANRKRETMNEHKDAEAEEQKQGLWPMDEDTLFYPLGLKTHGHSAGNCVFVTWSENYLINFVFKTSAKTKRFSVKKVRVAIEPEDEVCDILILELNTLLLMRSGRVHYFSSVKYTHAISWLSGVRCISAAAAGFSVIRLLPDNTLSLEVYRDVVNLGQSASTMLQRYDITFDERNLFNCQWQDERFTLHSQVVQTEHLHFMEQLIAQSCVLNNVQEVHFFTVSGNVFALIGGTKTVPVDVEDGTVTTDYHIQLLRTYATNVLFIQTLCHRQFCLVFLQCGTIDIWFMSKLAQALCRQAHHTGAQYIHYEFATANECFYFTDARQLAQLQFHYVDALDAVQVHETFKAISDIEACSWSVSLELLVCLSSNNIFYHLPFKKLELAPLESGAQPASPQFENLQQLYELTPARITELLQQAHVVQEVARLPLQLHQAIEQEFVRQQLLAVTENRRLYRDLCEAVLEFRTQLPASFLPDTVLLYTNTSFQLHNNSYFTLLHLRITRNDIFQAPLWQLHIQYRDAAHLLHIPTALLHKPLCVVIPLARATHSLLPHFHLKLLTFIAGCRNDCEFMAISLPIPVKTQPATYAQLFSHTHSALTICAELSIAQLIAQFKRHNVGTSIATTKATATENTPLRYTLGLPKSCSFENICCLFGTVNKAFNNTAEALLVQFMYCRLNISYDATRHCITLECQDAAALYYSKLYLFFKFSEALEEKEVVEVAGLDADMQQVLMQHQCTVERCYGSLLQMDNDSVSSNALHLENLDRIYTKIRSECCYNMLS